jgi:adenosylcobinamide-phosphate synthase
MAEALTLALFLDILIGDPANRYHPTRLVGLLAVRLEAFCRRLPLPQVIQGTVFLTLTLGTVLFPVGLVTLAASFFPGGWILNGVMIYFALGGSCLAREVQKVAVLLLKGNLARARSAVAMLVSRDASALDETGIATAGIETLAENFGDAVCSTLFYALLGGPVLVWLHRTANTLDAMVGYKNDSYLRFGKVPALFDDLLNFAPARLSALALSAVAPILGGNFRESFRAARYDAPGHESPNAGWPISAAAGALDIRLGGPTVYGGRLKEKPFFGTGPRPFARDLQRALTLFWAAYALTALGAIILSEVLWS